MEIRKDKDLLGNEIDFARIYLFKDNCLIGLFGIGDANSSWILVGLDGSKQTISGFNAMEKWGNEYDWDGNMLGRGSFRLNYDFETEINQYKNEGWIEVSPLFLQKELESNET